MECSADVKTQNYPSSAGPGSGDSVKGTIIHVLALLPVKVRALQFTQNPVRKLLHPSVTQTSKDGAWMGEVDSCTRRPRAKETCWSLKRKELPGSWPKASHGCVDGRLTACLSAE